MTFCRNTLFVFRGKRCWEGILQNFYCAKAHLVIELDGGQHYEEEHMEKDQERTAFLEGYGLRVVRIPNNEVNQNFEGVCRYIDAAVGQSLSQPDG